MAFSRRLQIVLLVAIISTALIVLENYKMPLNIFLWRSIFDFGHIPLFGMIAIAFLGISQTLWERRFANPMVHYLIAFCLAGLLGLITEIIQYFTPRDADFWDIIHDGFGALCFLVLYLTFDHRLHDSQINISRKTKYTIRLMVILLLLVALMPTLGWLGAYLNRNANFPELCNFESVWERKFIFADGSSLSIVPSPKMMNNTNNSKVGRIEFKAGYDPGFKIVEPYPDWTEYNSLSFSIYSDNPEIIKLDLQINGRNYKKDKTGRYNRILSIEPGLNNIIIPLEDVASAPENARMDMSKIDMIALYPILSEKNITLYLDNFSLQ